METLKISQVYLLEPSDGWSQQSYEKDQVAWETIFPESADQSCNLFLAFLK